MLHEFRRSFIVYFPQARDHTGCASVHETSGESYQAFAANILAQSCLAGAQYDEIYRRSQRVNVLQSHKTVQGFAFTIYGRKYQARVLRVLRIKQSMRGEMENCILTQVHAE